MAKETKIRWFGHSAFQITSGAGTVILTDPFGGDMGSYTIPSVSPDAVTVSHEHGDHNNLKAAKGNPTILRGLTGGGRDWNTVDRKVKDVRIYNVAGTYHDGEKGTKRGKNSPFVFEMDDLRIVHLGDLGHVLTDDQIKKIGAIDIILVPIGGYYTIDAKEATKVMDQLKPKIAVPMHYKTAAISSWPISSTDDFLKGKKVRQAGGNTLTVSKEMLPAQTEVVVVDYD